VSRSLRGALAVAGLWLGISVSLSLAACGNVMIGTAGTPRSVPMRVRGTPGDASVTIDDQRVGSLAIVAARGMRVPPGRHRVSIEAPGYFPYDVVVEAKDEVVLVDVRLTPIPD
jgi:hypothetical protein